MNAAMDIPTEYLQAYAISDAIATQAFNQSVTFSESQEEEK